MVSPSQQAREAGECMAVRDGGTLSLGWLRDFLPRGFLEQPHKRVLDIGCWDGGLLSQFPAIWDRCGVEFNARAAAAARKRGLTIFETTIQQLDRSEWFDLVLMMDVLEHIPAHIGIFGQVRSLLRPGGMLVALTGNGDTFAARSFKGYWYYFN
jgi:2-polyprenyl-3-methyl-5-hydroxy-6-metoxy-1,4-benzoquinol methylase